MDLRLPPSPPNPAQGYHTVEQELAAPVLQEAPPIPPAAALPVTNPPATPRLRYDRLLLVLIVLGLLGTGGFYGIRWGYAKLTAKEEPQTTQQPQPEFFSYATTLANQPLLFTLPTTWGVIPSPSMRNTIEIYPISKVLTSKKQPSPAFSVEVIPLTQPKNSSQLTNDYVANLKLGTYLQSFVSVGDQSPSGMVITNDSTTILTVIEGGSYYLQTTIPTLDSVEDTNLVTPILNQFKQSVRFK